MTWNFAAELARHGPGTDLFPAERHHAHAYCAHLARNHSENFTVASLLLPRRLLPHFHAIYSFCRWADDLADEAGSPAHSTKLLHWWRQELLSIYSGEPRHPITVALAETVTRFAIPREPFLDLIDAFEQDQRVTRYDSFEQLIGYCRRSANPVGNLVLHLFECATPERIALSDEICTGLQLANFWQDVSRDLDIGRIYLPREDRERFHVHEQDIVNKRMTPEFGKLLRFEVERTRDYFRRGCALLPMIPARLRVDVELFIRGGIAVLDAIEQAGFDVFHRRPKVSKWRKARLLVESLWRAARTGGLVWKR